jgi:hypothetical protein
VAVDLLSEGEVQMGFLKRTREGTSSRRVTLVGLAIVTTRLLVAGRTRTGTAKRLLPQAASGSDF